jgi:uncharacterized OB-fold protein
MIRAKEQQLVKRKGYKAGSIFVGSLLRMLQSGPWMECKSCGRWFYTSHAFMKHRGRCGGWQWRDGEEREEGSE